MYAKKSLGQNFLMHSKVAERIAEGAGIESNDVVLEIGPGTGKLTEHLLKCASQVIAVEKDNYLFESLKEKFKEAVQSKKLILLNEDILDFKIEKLKIKNYKIVANIPYNITGAILKKFLTAKNKPSSMTLLVQKEVAERIMARDKKESLLSISVKIYGEPKILFAVGRGNFIPAPNVDSAVIKISGISNKNFKKGGVSEEKFWEVVRAGFAHKRKRLGNNLKTLKNRGINEGNWESSRAEDLSPEDWFMLLKSL